jgi:hypothetical protein
MKRIICLILATVALFNCSNKELDPIFIKYTGYYVFDFGLNSLDLNGIEKGGPEYKYAKVDILNHKIEFLNSQSKEVFTYGFVYLEKDIFYFKNSEKVFFRLFEEVKDKGYSTERKLLKIGFLRQIDKPNEFINHGYNLPALSSFEDCINHRINIIRENERISTPPGQE